MPYTYEKKFAALISVISNSILIILKLIAGFLSGSISIISEAVHSTSDLLASFLALFAVSKSSEPADEKHQFGHGKYEDFSGLIEGSLIIGASIYIIYESTVKIIERSHAVLNENLGMAVMLFSTVINIIVSTYLFRVAKKTDSIALFADAEHLRTDVYSSFGVFLGLLTIKMTGIHILDPIVAILIAIIIFKAGFTICKKATYNLLDTTLPQEENKTIISILDYYSGLHEIEYKDLKTRKSGIVRQIELTLLLNPDKTIKEGHMICDEIENEIERTFANSSYIIHLEPLE